MSLNSHKSSIIQEPHRGVLATQVYRPCKMNQWCKLKKNSVEESSNVEDVSNVDESSKVENIKEKNIKEKNIKEKKVIPNNSCSITISSIMSEDLQLSSDINSSLLSFSSI